MTLHIDDVGLLILAVGLFVGHAGYQHTRAASGAASEGDAVGAIGAAAAVITALFLLFGGGGSASAEPAPRPTGHALTSHQVSAVLPD
ncbi:MULTISPECIES: hypothetical protein [unclassified Streptomyces]|uniref:hypothetical protein n=1 Tax=unclassified Streptomyces TaxID=2593676 RepID=UPI002E2BB098|nr:hypothetical protein [Streptomyces sp. NBC_00273]